MIKLLMTFIIALLAITGCTSDNEDYIREDEKQIISFARPLIYGGTRAVTGEINGAYPTTEKFMVYGVKYPVAGNYQGWAHTTSEQIFANTPEEFGHNATLGGWIASTAYYFSQNYKYAFAAYSPSSITTTGTVASSGAASAQTVEYDAAKGLQITNYFAGDIGSQTDLMYAPRKYNITSAYNLNTGGSTEGTDGNTNVDYNGVNLTFRHALASVHFKVCVDPTFAKARINADGSYNKREFEITSINISAISTTGSFDENITSDVAGTGISTSQNTPIWTPGNDRKLHLFLPVAGTSKMNVPLPINDNEITDPVDVNKFDVAKAKDICDITFSGNLHGYSGLMIPQSLKKTADHTPQIIVTWIHNYKDPNTNADKSYEKTTKVDVETLTEKWEPGIRYTYTLIFKGDIIDFAPVVEEWQDAGNTPEDGSHDGGIQI